MEGGNKYNVNLEAGLDVSSSDMLVPVNQPTFQHNWQKYQGKFLPSSLRFEKNGWAAGWNVIDFNYSASRIEVDGMYASALKLNNNPTYSVNLYDTADSDKSVYEKKVIPYSKLLTSNVELNGNTITGELSNGKAFTVNWDPETETASIEDADDFEFSATLNANYTRSFSIEDRKNKFSVDNNLYAPDALTGNGLVNSINYTKFENGMHYWGEIEYNGTVLTMPDGSVVSDLIIDGNTISFNASQTRDESFIVNYTIDKYFEAFNKCNARPAVGDYMTVATDAHSAKKYNYYKVNLPNRSLAVNSGIPIDVKVPVWTTLGLKITFDEYAGVKWPDNITAVKFKAPAKYFTLRYTSVFSGKDITVRYSSLKVDSDVYLPGKEGEDTLYRFGAIECNNTIVAASSFTGKPLTIRSEFWVTGTRRRKTFRNWNSYDWNPDYSSYPYGEGRFKGKEFAEHCFGDYVAFGSPFVNTVNYVKYNEWVDWDDDTNPVYTEADISRMRYIAKRDDAASFIAKVPDEYTDEADYFKNNLLKDVFGDEAMTTQLCDSKPGWHWYVESDPVIPWRDAFDLVYTGFHDEEEDEDGNTHETTWLWIGRYKYNSYVSGARDYSTDASCCPFGILPCCNVSFNGRTYTGVLGVKYSQTTNWIDPASASDKVLDRYGVIEFITDPEEFIEYVMGTYDGSVDPLNSPFDVDDNKIKRKVTTYKTVFDFNHSDINSTEAKRVAWDEQWNKWYPDIENPADFKVNTSFDDTYLDYTNIELSADQSLSVTILQPPAIYLGRYSKSVEYQGGETIRSYSVYLKCFNSYDMMPWENAPELDTSIFENHEDVSDNYTSESGQADSKILFDYNESTGDVSGYSYIHGYFGESAVSGDVLIAHEQSMFENINRWISIKAKIQSGRAYFYGECKDGFTGWIKEFGVSYTNGQYNKYADQYDESGKKVKRWQYTLTENMERISAVTVSYDSEDGLVIAQPFWAHLCYELNYIKYGSELAFAGDPSSVIEFKRLEDASSLLKDKTKSYIRVDGTDADLPLSRDWFKIELIGISPTEKAQFKLSPVSGGQLFYSVKKTGSDGKEIEYDYYYPTVIGYNGNMKSISSNMCQFDLLWSPDIFYVPSAMTFEFNASITDSLHKFYAKASQIFNNVNYTIGSPESKVGNYINISLVLGSADKPLYLKFDTKKQSTFILEDQEISLSDYNTVINFSGSERSIANGKSVVVPMSVTYSYTDIVGKFAKSSEDDLISWSSNRFTCVQGQVSSHKYTYDMQLKKLIDNSAAVTVNSIDGGENIIFTSSAGVISFSAILKNISNDIIKLSYDEHVYEVSATELFGIDNSIIVKSTDIRNPGETLSIGKLDADNYQFVKQDWNTTTEVENFWWVNDKCILELTASKFVLKRKTDKLTDWNGDEFIPVAETLRSDVLNEHTTVYFVTNTYKQDSDGLFVTLQATDDTTIECTVYDIYKGFKELDKFNIVVSYKQISSTLNDVTYRGSTVYFNTYSNHTASMLLSQAQWTNTITDNKLFIGCHLSNNFDQWTAVFDIIDFNCVACIQGYGFVGLKGDLTGGMIPSDYFSITSGGFNDTVYDISVLDKKVDELDADSAYKVSSLNEINQIEKRVVGTAEKQWYIQKELHGIVSHIRYNNGQFIIETLPITNKFDAVYKSPSFHNHIIGDAMVQGMPFEGLFNFDSAAKSVWSIICSACGYPLLFAYSPRLSTLAYLQQTFGQYAYVHYNSSESDDLGTIKSTADKNNMNDRASANAVAPVLSDSMTFDKQVIEQSALNTAPVDKFMIMLFGMFAPPLAHIDRNHVVNGEVNQTAIFDTGKKYTQFAMENLGNLGVKALLTESNEQSITSSVVGIKSLDMFYSTSDKQHVYAGPGFVEHQFVANCVAQSATDCAAEGQVRQLTLVLKSLTAFQGMLVCKLEELAANGMLAAASAVENAMICGTNVGAYAAAAMTAVAYGMKTAQAATELAYAALDKILDTVTQRGITCEDVGRISRYSLSLEAKHKYGEKNEVFMWPCVGVPSLGLTYKDETVDACVKKSTWQVNLQATKCYIQDSLITQVTSHYDDLYDGDTVEFSSAVQGEKKNHSLYNNYGEVDYYTATCIGSATDRQLPADMACVQGVESFLPGQAFKNENIACSAPVFAPSMFQDYVIDATWDLTQCCTYGRQLWVTVKDTKVINCQPSNMRVTNDFCGIATSYTAIEVKRGLSKSYMRPWAITPNVLALNCSGYNAILANKLYHAFDGVSYRLVEWKGSSAMNKNFQTRLYGFQINDRFKRGNICPANEALGNFDADPVQCVTSIDKFWTKTTIAAKQEGLENGAIGEDKDATRWALPVFTEPVTTLPAAVKTLTAMPLNVYDGVTGLTTNLANNQTAYKAPLSVDFTIGKNVYRQTEEYICAVQTDKGLDIVTDIIPSLGLKFIGSTPTEAYFYSKATRCYYMFTGTNLVKMDMMERFRDIQKGYWDFVNQEVVMPCLMTFKRLNPEVLDTDTETDNIIVPLMSRGQVTGELPPPLTTIFNDKSWYKCVSLPSGFAYQGPNRVIINRSVFTEYMLESLKDNIGKWSKVSRETYVKRRGYLDSYSDVNENIDGIDGWTYNPFLLVTSPFGIDENTDCIFEWVITFCWPVEMDLIYGVDNYACVNIMSETMTPGGKQKAVPTHVFLTKELFACSNNYGYYSFRYQSKNGAGNRERLSIWSDQYIAISSITCEVKPVTQRRTEQLTQQQDVLKLKEL